MEPSEFRRHAHDVVDWIADYMENAGSYPVLSRSEPGDIRGLLPGSPPADGEPMEAILGDFRSVILPGITHWNHPRFFGYFPCTNSGPSILGDMLSSGLGVNAMSWQTSPAATELEEAVMDWLRQMLGLPEAFRGVIQDTASTATLCAVICAREKTTGFGSNLGGLSSLRQVVRLRVYASGEAHSSVEKAVRMAGIGAENLVAVPVDDRYAMVPGELDRAIRADLSLGYTPCAVVATVGTTSSTAIDPVGEIAAVAGAHGLWLHVDAALAGNAAILPEKRYLIDGIEGADSLVFNPHKWLFTNFDCSAFFCRRPEVLTTAMSMSPEYLKTGADRQVTNYRDWGIQLGRRFRALKLWFVIRSYGVKGLQDLLRLHLTWAQEFAGWVDGSEAFERLAPVPVNTVCFRYNPGKGRPAASDEAAVEAMNRNLMGVLNREGEVFITHTKLSGRFCLRVSIGQTRTRREDITAAWEAIRRAARGLESQPPDTPR